MKVFRLLFLLALPLVLAACGPTAQQQADYTAVQRSGVSPAIYDKMVHGDPLSIGDIEALSQARVSDGVIIRYLRDRGTIYSLNSNDVQNLRKAGVSQSVVDYMLDTSRIYANSGWYPDVAIGVGWDPYWYGPYYGPYWGGGYYHHHHYHH